MHAFCTLFNSYYLTKGIAMHASLMQQSHESHLYILAMDDFTYTYLAQEKLANVTAIKLSDFETDELLAIKKDRTFAEYCWTCSSSVIEYCLDTFKLAECTYVDADLYFYADPANLLNELDKNKQQVLITEHGFDDVHKFLEVYGRFCIQFLSFSQQPESRQILHHWKDQCIDWCYSWAEIGRFGDQKYLDPWPDRYPEVHVLEHFGALAPWNISRFRVVPANNAAEKFDVIEKKTDKRLPLVFYHFHDLKFYKNNTFCLVNGYDVSEVTSTLYYPYLAKLSAIEKSVKEKFPTFDPEASRVEFISDNFFRSMRARFDIIVRKRVMRMKKKIAIKR